nr:hypothetical protein Iba_chr15bCG5790 [Ipomoea batatas]
MKEAIVEVLRKLYEVYSALHAKPSGGMENINSVPGAEISFYSSATEQMRPIRRACGADAQIGEAGDGEMLKCSWGLGEFGIVIRSWRPGVARWSD